MITKKTGYRFIKYRDNSNEYDFTNVLISVDKDASRDELLEAFKSFLVACGFAIDGEIDVVKNEEQTEES
jgi:hypothetical protein